MRAPDDVTLVWAEDNWGNVRGLPTAAERARPGGAGIYYHFDYHGSPRSYQWLNTSPLPKIWDQMLLAKQYGADRIWMVNVGHFKGYELPTEYLLRLARGHQPLDRRKHRGVHPPLGRARIRPDPRRRHREYPRQIFQIQRTSQTRAARAQHLQPSRLSRGRNRLRRFRGARRRGGENLRRFTHGKT